MYKNFNVVSSRRPVSVDFADGYPEHLLATPPTASQYHPAKYPYSAITRKPMLSTDQSGSKVTCVMHSASDYSAAWSRLLQMIDMWDVMLPTMEIHSWEIYLTDFCHGVGCKSGDRHLLALWQPTTF